MMNDLQLAGYVEDTQQRYLKTIQHFAEFHRRSPEKLGQSDVRQWVEQLTAPGTLSPQRLNQHFAALRFLYGKTLGRPDVVSFLSSPKKPQHLPTVLSPEEVARVLDAIVELKYRVFFTTLYATGLRVSEACQLRTEDIDAGRGVIHVRNGKGRKDRMVGLGLSLLTLLRMYWKQERPPAPWLFASRNGGYLKAETAREALFMAAKQAGLAKRVTPHILRHCYATHLIEQGTQLRVVQAMLGHARPESTAHYTRVSAGLIAKVKSPLDCLPTLR
jgi:site-specific recombinase XerD